jgi:hypothetical protein
MTLDFITFSFVAFANLISFLCGLGLVRDGIQSIFFKCTKGFDWEGAFCLIGGAIVLITCSATAGMTVGVASLGATLCDWDMKMKVKQLLKEGKIYDYSLREATDDAHQMANEYHCRAFVIDLDGTGDFDVVLTKPEDDTLIMRVVWPYKWVEDAKTSNNS